MSDSIRERVHDRLAGRYKRKSHEEIDRMVDRMLPIIEVEVDLAVRQATERMTEEVLPEWGDEGDRLVKFYERQVKHVADRLRSIAEDIENLAHRERRNINDGKLEYLDSARSIVHKAQWGFANAPLDTLLDAAGDVDRYAVTHQERPEHRDPGYQMMKRHLEARHGVGWDQGQPTLEEMRELHKSEHEDEDSGLRLSADAHSRSDLSAGD